MNTVETSTTYQHDDEIIRLKLEYSTLVEEVTRNNRMIHDIQVRDMGSLESMKYHMQRKRELNERMRQLKKLLLERYVDGLGNMVKIDEWMAKLNIPSSPPALGSKSPDDALVTSLEQYYNNDAHIGDINDTVEQNTDDMLAQLSYKIDQLTKTVNSTGLSDQPVEETQSRSDSSTNVTQHNDSNLQKNKIDDETAFLLQHLKRSDPSFILSPIKSSPSSTALDQQQPSVHQPTTTPRKRSGTTRQVNPPHRLKYPDNVELKSIKSPPTLPHKRKTYTMFTTKHNICRKPSTPVKTAKHKHVGDYMVHSRNPAVAPPVTSFSCGTGRPSQSRLCGFVWTAIIIISVSLLFYMYPSLLNCILLLKDGAEQARDEVTRILDSIIVQAGGEPWLSSNLAETEMPLPSGSPSPDQLYSSWCSSWSTIVTQPANELTPEQDQSTMEILLDYAKSVYRYVLYDFP